MKKQQTNVQFADTYKGCSVVANLMGLNVETVRKRAKAGKIPATQDKNGTWIFQHNDLVKAGILPFATSGYGPSCPAPAALSNTGHPLLPKKNVTEVIFVLDRSGSMGFLMSHARDNLQTQVDTLKKAAGPNDQFFVTLINFDDTVDITLQSQDVTGLGDVRSLYLGAGGSTRLNDAVLKAADLAETRDDGTKAFLISVVTDGQENASNTSAAILSSRINRLVNAGRCTFAYAGPPGSQQTAYNIGIPAGNVTTWETTVRGTQFLGAVQSNSIGTYAKSRSVGVMSSMSYYAQPVTTNAVSFAGKLDNALEDVTDDVEVTRVAPTDPVVINKFCEGKFGKFEKGKYFYQLTESEKVQDYKAIIVQDTTAGKFYKGWDSAKKLLGIPDFRGTVRIKPGKLGEFKVFVQSTSMNRKLVPGTAVVSLK